MLKFTKKLSSTATFATSLTLPFESRTKSRLRVTLDNGLSAGIMLPRGHILRHGDLIATDENYIVQIHAAAESVSSITSDNTHLLSRACYHLGNRHIPLQIEQDMIRYQHDHVLDHLMTSMGLHVTHGTEPFEPESGAYHTHAHTHSS